MVYNSDGLEITFASNGRTANRTARPLQNLSSKHSRLCWREAGHAVRTLGDQKDRRALCLQNREDAPKRKMQFY